MKGKDIDRGEFLMGTAWKGGSWTGLAAAAVLLMASTLAAPGAVTLFDFEDGRAPSVRAKTFSVGVTNAFATSGENALRFRCDRWRKGMPEWPSFNLVTQVRDWSGYDRLAIDVVSLVDAEGDNLSTFIAGPEGRVQNGLSASFSLPSRGYAQWVIELKKWPKETSVTNIGRVHLFTSDPRAVDVVIDRVTLLKKGEAAPVPASPCVTRDILAMAMDAHRELVASNRALCASLERVPDYMAFCAKAMESPFSSPRMFLGTATSMEKVRPRGRFSVRTIPEDGIAVRLAGNEHESVQLLVAPRGEGLRNVRVRAGDLKSASGASFSAKNVACDVMGYVDIKRHAPYMTGLAVPTNAAPGYARELVKPDLGWWPDPILDFLDGVDIADTDLQSFWVRVRCPEAQPAGTYRGELTVSADGVEPVRVPFSVRVNGFAIGRASPLPLAITFSPGPTTQFEDEAGLSAATERRRDPLSPVNLWKHREQEWGDFLADYFITMDSLYHNGGNVHFDVLERLKKQGRLGVFNLGYWSYPPSTNDAAVANWREDTLGRLRKAYDEAKARGLLDHAYIYGCDEIATNFFPMIRLAVKELKAAFPGVPISTTAYDDEFGVGTPLDVMDWFTPLTPKFDKAKAAASRAAGHQVWWYICCGPRAPHANMFIECPAIEGRLLMGAQATRMQPDGFLYYQISIWNSKRCITSGPFTDWDPRSWTKYHGDGSWTCVGPDGRPLPTIRLENFRDGLEDYAYSRLLRERLAARAGNPDEWCRKAKALLDVPGDVMESMTNYTGDPAAVYRWRDSMADLIEESFACGVNAPCGIMQCNGQGGN